MVILISIYIFMPATQVSVVAEAICETTNQIGVALLQQIMHTTDCVVVLLTNSLLGSVHGIMLSNFIFSWMLVWDLHGV